MKYAPFLVVLALFISACGSSETPQVPTLSPATVQPSESPPAPEPSDPPAPTAIPLDTPIASAESFPDPNAYIWIEVLSGLERPVDIQNAGDGSNRLFIVEKVGP